MGETGFIELLYDQSRIPVARNQENVISVFLRNSHVLHSSLGWDYINDYRKYKEAMEKQYDSLILGYSTMYCDFKRAGEIIANNPNANLYFLTTDYTEQLPAALIYSKRPFELIANFERQIKHVKILEEYCKKINRVNLNSLVLRNPNNEIPKKYDLIYYGQKREHRERYFREYFQGNYIHVSALKKNVKWFRNVGCDTKWVKRLKWNTGRETLNLFKYSLYMEDENTHDNYSYLASRFYECLTCNVVQFFDINCKNTIERSGIDFEDEFFVDGRKDLKNKVENSDFDRLLRLQKRLWLSKALMEKKSVIESVDCIIKGNAKKPTIEECHEKYKERIKGVKHDD